MGIFSGNREAKQAITDASDERLGEVFRMATTAASRARRSGNETAASEWTAMAGAASDELADRIDRR